MSEVVRNMGEGERGGGGGTSEDEQGGEEWKKKSLPWSSGGRECACDKDWKPCRGWGEYRGAEWRLEAEHSTERARGWGGWIIGTESWSVWEALCLMCASQQNEWWEDYSSTFSFTGGFLAGFYSLKVSTLKLECVLVINLCLHNRYMVRIWKCW